MLGLACLVSLTLAAWVTATRHGNAVRPALATALQAWLLANHTGLAIAGGSVGIVPLGLTVGLGALLVRGGRQVARLSGGTDLFDCLAAAFAVALPYGVIAALLTNPAGWGQVRPQPLQALAGGFSLALGCALVGALRETGQRAVVLARVPADVRRVLRAGLAATAVIVAFGAASRGCGSGDACRTRGDGDEQSGRRGVGVVAHGSGVGGVPAERRHLGKCAGRSGPASPSG